MRIAIALFSVTTRCLRSDIDDVQGFVSVDTQLPYGRPGRLRDPVGLRRHFNLLQMGSTRANLEAEGLLDDGHPLQDLLIDGRLA